MKKILSALFILVSVFGFTVLPASAGSIYYSIPLWGDTAAAPIMHTTFAVTSLGDITKNPDFASTGATVTIALYNNAINRGDAAQWNTTTPSGATNNGWANASRTFTTGEQSFLADSQNATATSTTWTSSTTWSNTTSNWGYGIVTISMTGATPQATDFAIQGFFYGSDGSSYAGFPVTISNF